VSLAHLSRIERWVFDDAEEIAEWINHRSDFDAATYVFERLMDLCFQALQASQLSVCIWNAPIRQSTLRPRNSIWNEAELETANGVANIEWFIKVRLNSQYLAVPRLTFGEISDWVNNSAQSLNHMLSFCGAQRRRLRPTGDSPIRTARRRRVSADSRDLPL